tara:strand:- start:1101 stop:1250 length:150 start_codon:yes stop_codon:yes gene_type:complete
MALAIVSLLAAVFLIGKYIIEERVRVESQKEFEKNLKNWDDKNDTKQKK